MPCSWADILLINAALNIAVAQAFGLERHCSGAVVKQLLVASQTHFNMVALDPATNRGL